MCTEVGCGCQARPVRPAFGPSLPTLTLPPQELGSQVWGCSLGFPLEQESSPRLQVCSWWVGDPLWESAPPLRPLWPRGGEGDGVGDPGFRVLWMGIPYAPDLVQLADMVCTFLRNP